MFFVIFTKLLKIKFYTIKMETNRAGNILKFALIALKYKILIES